MARHTDKCTNCRERFVQKRGRHSYLCPECEARRERKIKAALDKMRAEA